MTLQVAIEAVAVLLVVIPLLIFVALALQLFYEEWQEWGWGQRIVAPAFLAVLVRGGLWLVDRLT